VCKKGNTGTIQERQQDRQNRKRIKKGNTIRTTAQEVSRKAAKELYKKKQHKKCTRRAAQKKYQERQYNKYHNIGSVQERQHRK
jgi:hypothetical protein